MEGSDEEAADRKYQKTDSGSAKAKYFAVLDDENSCSDYNSSQSEEDPVADTLGSVHTRHETPICQESTMQNNTLSL